MGIKMSRNMNEAVMSGNMQEVQMRINMGEDVNQMVFPRYTTPLHDATTCGRTEIARLLIKMGADVNAKDYKGSTPLRLARRYGKDESDAPSRKTSVGVQPPWESSSRKASRREEV